MKKHEITAGVYVVACSESSKVHIGVSYDIIERLKEHKKTLQENRHANTEIQEDWNQFGEDSFVFGILQACNSGMEAKRKKIVQDILVKGKCSFYSTQILHLTEQTRKRQIKSTKM